MKLSASQMAERQRGVQEKCAAYDLSNKEIYAYARAMSGRNDRYSEFYDWCDKFFQAADTYSRERMKALQTNNIDELLTDGTEEFICKVAKYGNIVNAPDPPKGLVRFITYCMVYQDLFDTKAQKLFARRYARDLGLKISNKDPDYFQKLADEISRYESGSFEKKRHRISTSLKGLRDRVHSTAEGMSDNMRESNPKLFTSYWVQRILEPSYSFYDAGDDGGLVTASNIAERHKMEIIFPIGTEGTYILVKQGEHYLICNRSGKVYWDRVVPQSEAQQVYMQANADSRWVDTCIAKAGGNHKWEQLELGLSDEEADLEEGPIAIGDYEDASYETLVRDDVTLIVTTDPEYVDFMQDNYPEDVRAYLCETFGTNAEKDFDVFLDTNRELINDLEEELDYPLPSDKYALILAVLDTLI